MIAARGADLLSLPAFRRNLPDAAEQREGELRAIRRPGRVGRSPGHAFRFGCLGDHTPAERRHAAGGENQRGCTTRWTGHASADFSSLRSNQNTSWLSRLRKTAEVSGLCGVNSFVSFKAVKKPPKFSGFVAQGEYLRQDAVWSLPPLVFR